MGPSVVTRTIDGVGKYPSLNEANHPQTPPPPLPTPTRNTGPRPEAPGPRTVAIPYGSLPTDAGASSSTSTRVPACPEVERIHPMQRWYVVHKGINPGVALGM